MASTRGVFSKRTTKDIAWRLCLGVVTISVLGFAPSVSADETEFLQFCQRLEDEFQPGRCERIGLQSIPTESSTTFLYLRSGGSFLLEHDTEVACINDDYSFRLQRQSAETSWVIDALQLASSDDGQRLIHIDIYQNVDRNWFTANQWTLPQYLTVPGAASSWKKDGDGLVTLRIEIPDPEARLPGNGLAAQLSTVIAKFRPAEYQWIPVQTTGI